MVKQITRITLLAALLLGLWQSAVGQPASADQDLYVVTKTIRIGDNEITRLGFIDQNGQMAIAPSFLTERYGVRLIESENAKISLPEFHDGRCLVASIDTTRALGVSWCYIDKTGQIVFDEKTIPNNHHLTIYPFSDGLAPVIYLENIFDASGIRYGFINTDGDIAIPAKFKNALPFSNGLALAQDTSGKWGYIDTKGNWAVPPKEGPPNMEVPARPFNDGMAMAIRPSESLAVYEIGFIDRTGKMVILNSDEKNIIDDFSEGMARCSKNYRQGFVDINGLWGIEPIFDDAKNFSNGMAAVKYSFSDNWGYINKKGELVIPPIFEDAGDFSEGKAWVGDRFIGKDGKTAVDAINLHGIQTNISRRAFALIDSLERNDSLINDNHNWILNDLKSVFQNNKIHCGKFRGSLAPFTIDHCGLIYNGYIDQNGNIKYIDSIGDLASFATDYLDNIRSEISLATEEAEEVLIDVDTTEIEEVIIETTDDELLPPPPADDHIYAPGEAIEIEAVEVEEEEKDDNTIFMVVEEDPKFPGGQEALYKYLAETVIYPQMARDNNITGRVYVSFVVEKDGSISNPRVLRDIGAGCGEEAVRAVQNMPHWIPGKQRGKPVRVQYNLPVAFNLH